MWCPGDALRWCSVYARRKCPGDAPRSNISIVRASLAQAPLMGVCTLCTYSSPTFKTHYQPARIHPQHISYNLSYHIWHLPSLSNNSKKQAFGPHWSPSFSISGHFRLIWTDKGLLACACLCCVARDQVTTRNLCISTISTATASPLSHLPALFTTIQSVSAPKCALLYWVSSAQCPQSVPPLYWVSGGQCQQPPTSSFAAINQRPRATPNSFWPLLLLNKFGHFWMSIYLELGHTVLRSEQDCSG